MPDPETDVELPVEDAAEQEQDVVTEDLDPAPDTAATDPAVLEADEADVVEQQSVVAYGDDDYR